MTARFNDPTAGFSLTEMLVVLAIIALAAGTTARLGWPSSSMDALDAAQQVRAALARARREALRTGQEQRVTFDPARATLTGTPQPIVLDGVVLSFRTASLQRGDGHREPAIAFLPDGGSSGGVVTIDDGRRAMTVRVHWLTGAIDVAAR